MKIYLEIEAISEEERINTGTTTVEMKNSEFMLLPTMPVRVPTKYWSRDPIFTVVRDDA